MADNQDTFAPVFAGDCIYDAAEAQNNIAPAFPTRWPVVELAQGPAHFGLVGVFLFDTHGGQAVEDTKLALAQPFVHHAL